MLPNSRWPRSAIFYDGEKYNISGENELNVFTVVKKILEIMGKSTDYFEYAENRPGHDDRYSLDSSKIQSSLEWKPIVDFDQGLTDTVNWYLDNRKWWSEFDQRIFDGYQWQYD